MLLLSMVTMTENVEIQSIFRLHRITRTCVQDNLVSIELRPVPFYILIVHGVMLIESGELGING